MILLKNKILKSIVLRRTKIGRAADLALPPRIVSSYFPMAKYEFLHMEKLHIYFYLQVSLRRDSLDIKEQDYYESLYNESQAQFNTYVKFSIVLS